MTLSKGMTKDSESLQLSHSSVNMPSIFCLLPSTGFKPRPFLGAGAAFSAVFQDSGGHRTFRDILAWSATCFTLGTVLAGAGGTVSGVGQIIHGTAEHRWLQGFAILSAVFIFSGIILLGVAMISLNASPATLAAGAVLVGLSPIFVVVALCMARCMVIRRRRAASSNSKGKQKEDKTT